MIYSLQQKILNENLTVEIRTTEFGTPTTQLVQDFARAVVSPANIQVSDNGEVPTRVTFPSPIYLNQKKNML